MVYRIYVKETHNADFRCFSGEINSLSWAKNVKTLLDSKNEYVAVEIRLTDRGY